MNSRPLSNFIKEPKTVIACKEFFCKSNILKDNLQKALKKITLFFFRTALHPYDTRMAFVYNSYLLVCYPYVTRMYSYVIRMPLVCTRMSLVCTRMSLVCHSYVLACHPYVTRMYSYVIRMPFVCTRMSSICHLYVLACHPYVTRTWFYHEPFYNPSISIKIIKMLPACQLNFLSRCQIRIIFFSFICCVF